MTFTSVPNIQPVYQELEENFMLITLSKMEGRVPVVVMQLQGNVDASNQACKHVKLPALQPQVFQDLDSAVQSFQ
jgi:hypothetical protein